MCGLCVRGEEVERELAKRGRVDSSFEGLSTDEPDSAAKNLHLYKAHKYVVSSQHQSYKEQQDYLKPGEVLVVLDFKENLQVGSGPIEVGNDYYTKTQVSCLGFAVCIGGNTATHYFDCISFSLSPDGLFVRESLDQVIPEIQKKVSCESETVSFFVDFVSNCWLCFFFLQTFLLDGLWTSLSLLRSDERPSLWKSTEARSWNNWSQFFCWTSWQISSGLTLFLTVSRAVSQWVVTEHLTNIDDLKKAISSDFEQSKTSVTVKNNSTPTTHSKITTVLLFKSKKNWTWQKIMLTQIIKIKFTVLLHQKSTVLGKSAK